MKEKGSDPFLQSVLLEFIFAAYLVLGDIKQFLEANRRGAGNEWSRVS